MVRRFFKKKKDNLVNIGSFLALRDKELADRARDLLVVFGGLHTYGGMSGRDMEALAREIREMVETDNHVRAGESDRVLW